MRTKMAVVVVAKLLLCCESYDIICKCSIGHKVSVEVFFLFGGREHSSIPALPKHTSNSPKELMLYPYLMGFN